MPIDPNTGQFLATYPPSGVSPRDDYLVDARYGTQIYRGPEQTINGVTYRPGDVLPYVSETRAAPTFLAGGNMQNIGQFLANVGAELDPRGLGGAIGRSAVNYSQSKAAQGAYQEQSRRQQDYNNRLFQILSQWGQMGPKGQMGPTSVKANDDRSFTIQGNLANEPNVQVAGEGTVTDMPTAPAKGRQPQPVGPTQANPQGGYQVGGRFYPSRTGVIGEEMTVGGQAPRQLPPETRPGGRELLTGEPQAPPPAAVAPTPAPQATTIINPPNIPGFQPITPPATNFLRAPTDQTQIIQGGGVNLPANTAAIAPTPRQRSQTMFDLRNFVPF